MLKTRFFQTGWLPGSSCLLYLLWSGIGATGTKKREPFAIILKTNGGRGGSFFRFLRQEERWGKSKPLVQGWRWGPCRP